MTKFFVSLIAASLFFITLPAARAQLFWDVNVANPGSSDDGVPNGTWNNTNTNWTTDGTNGSVATVQWDNANHPVAVFSAANGGSNSGGNYTVTVGGAESTDGLTFNDILVTLANSGSGSLTLTGATPTISVPTATNKATINVPIGGAAGLTLAGGSQSQLQLGAANTYTGATSIGAGTQLKLGASGVIPDASLLTLAHGNLNTLFDLNGFDETVRSIASSGSGSSPTIAIGNNTLTINDQAGDVNTYFGLYTASSNGKIVKNGDGQLTLNNFPAAFSGEFVINSGIVGIGQNNIFGTGGTGSTLTINPNNTPTGPTLIRTGGTINLGVTKIHIGGNFTYDNNGGNDTQLNGSNGASTTTLMADNPVITVAGDTIVDGAKTSGTFIFAGDIVDDGNIRGFTKSGPGTLTLGSKGNSYRGETTIQQGALNVRYQTNSANIGFSRIGDGNGRVNLSGGKLTYNGSTDTTTRSFTVTNPVRVTADSEIDYASTTTGLTNSTDPAGVIFDFTINPNGDAFDWTGGTLTFRHNGASQGIVYRPSFSRTGFNYAGPVVLSGAGTRKTVLQSTNTSGTQTWSGAISGNGSFRRVASGGETDFTGANTFTGGTIVDGGTLMAQGSTATLGGGDVTVNAGNVAISAGVANAIADTAKLTLAGGGTANTPDTGFISLATGINEHVTSLVLGATTMAAGTYGAAGSAAANIGLLNPNEYFSGLGIITVGAAALAGDYNGDGKVNAADYVAWRMGQSPNPNTIGDYNTWRANFGAGAGSGSGGLSSNGSTVPEPGTLSLFIFAISSVLIASSSVVRRRQS